MTITVSLEELKKYQEESRGWGFRRGDSISQWVKLNSDFRYSGMLGQDSTRLDKELAKWDSENPQPTLIPYL